MRGAGLVLAVALWGMAPFGAAQAQGQGDAVARGVVQSPVLVVEFEQVYVESAFGRRVAAELEAESAAIAAESRRIEAELTEEERDLTEQRKTMTPDAFRALAEAFDEKVQALRAEQDEKARALAQKSDEARRRFLALARPAMEAIMREAGAVVVLDRRTVFLSASAVDVTDAAIARIDALIGDGATP